MHQKIIDTLKRTNYEGQQIMSEGFPVRSFTITWELSMPRLKLDFQSRILSQEIIFLHTWSFLPFVTLQLHIWVKDHCIRQADQEQKIWSSIRFSSFAHENFVFEEKAGTANMPGEY